MEKLNNINQQYNMEDKKALVISLIKDNLINTKLVIGLNELGLDAGHFHLSLADIVIDLMDAKMNDDKFEAYLDLYEEVTGIDIAQDPKLLDDLTEEIYNHLSRYIKR